jgi:hypothetical protein
MTKRLRPRSGACHKASQPWAGNTKYRLLVSRLSSHTCTVPIVRLLAREVLCIEAVVVPMSLAMTCLSNMTDTNSGSFARRLLMSKDRGLRVTSHGVSVTVSDTQPTQLFSSHLVSTTLRLLCTTSKRRQSGIAAVELLEESKSKQRCHDGTAAIGEQMDRFVVSRSHGRTCQQDRRHALWFSTLLLYCSLIAPAQTITQQGNKCAPFTARATHLLGFADASNDSAGMLSVQDDLLQFEQNGQPGAKVAKVKIASVRDVFLGAESKQVGGLPMTLGKTAAPFGGGRVVSLFAHKKYDTVTLEYADSDGGFHGAIFQLAKGQGELVKNELIAQGLTINSRQDQSTNESPVEATRESK